LETQQRRADEVIITVRDTDTETRDMLRDWDVASISAKLVTVNVSGQVQALNAGLAEVQTDIVAITDDDAAPRPDWTQRIITYFEQNPAVGGVGGRDYLHVGGVLQDGAEPVVGRVPLVGRHVGNHHIGVGDARYVDTLKGVNGAYRVEALRPIGFDTRLHGTGAQVYWEISLGLALKRAGWKLIYDPLIAVDHFSAPRFDEDQRSGFNALATENLAYNETLIRLDHVSGLQRLALIGWAILIGTRAAPGLAQWVRFVPRQGALAGAKLRAALKGRFDALRDAGVRPWHGETTNIRRGPTVPNSP
jgi:GT2 family glycosyltransferase